MKTRTAYNRTRYKNKQSTLPSLTIPNETYTIPELIRRFTKGIDDGITRPTTYQEGVTHDDIDMEKFSRLDINDKHEFAEHNQQRIDQLVQNQKDAIQEHLEAQEASKQQSEGNPSQQPSEPISNA